jgi:hypothetical protein
MARGWMAAPQLVIASLVLRGASALPLPLRLLLLLLHRRQVGGAPHHLVEQLTHGEAPARRHEKDAARLVPRRAPPRALT